MLPAEPRFAGIRKLVAQERYFILHAPRQIGKTTLIMSLADELRSQGRVAVRAAIAALLCACTTSRTLGNSTEDATRADCLGIVTQATLHMGIALGINDARYHDDVVLDVRDGRVVGAHPTRHGCPDATQRKALIENINDAGLGTTFTGSCRIGDYVTPSTR